MTPVEEQLRAQLKEAEETALTLGKRLDKLTKDMESFRAMALACSHLPDEMIVVSRQVWAEVDGKQVLVNINLEARHFKALLEGESR